MGEEIARKKLLIVGQDPCLLYLIQRYAKQCGFSIYHHQQDLSQYEIFNIDPTAILFLTIYELEKAGKLVNSLASGPILILVCVSLVDEARANELGADICFFHPLTLTQFEQAICDSAKQMK